MPPRGYYLAREVGWLAGVSGDRIGQWARRGYIRSSQSTGQPRVYSFQDVAEAMVVHELLERGVRHGDIRQAITSLRDDFGDWPLTHAPIWTGTGRGRPPLLIEKEGAHWDLADRPWHQVLGVQDLRRIREDLGRGGWVVRELPDLKHVEVDPDRLSGQPTIRGRRIAVDDVAELADTPGGRELLKDGYELVDEQIDDALRWSRATAELELAA
jgi:uncharacterized protein (DUF433 family)/DNA-binding transcriptional MerR regulator